MAEPQAVTVTSGGREYIAKTSKLIAEAFREDPNIRFLLSSMTDEARLAYMPTYFRDLFQQAMLNKAVFQEANDWSYCAVWMLPGRHIDNYWTISPAAVGRLLWNAGFGGCKRMLWDYQQQSDACKAKALLDESGNAIKRYYYLFIIGTASGHRGKGLPSGLIAQYQARIKKDGSPIWLEATTAKSRDIYAQLRFQTVGEIIVGKGTHAETETKSPGGPGVTLWGMVWRPSSKP